MVLRGLPERGLDSFRMGAGPQKNQPQQLPTCWDGRGAGDAAPAPRDLISHFDLMKPQKNPYAPGLGRVSDLVKTAPCQEGRTLCHHTDKPADVTLCTSAADCSFLSFIINYSCKDWVLLVLCILPEDSWTWRGVYGSPKLANFK